MKSKLLKFELFLYFLVATLSMVFYYCQDYLPDHMYEVSSRAASTNVLSYYAVSLVSLIGTAIGPWVLLPFASFIALYAFLFSKRDSVLDLFNFVFITGLFLGLTYFFLPEFLGEGIALFVRDQIGDLWLALATLVLAVLTYINCFRGSFKSGVVSFASGLRQLGSDLLDFVSPARLVDKAKSYQSNFTSWDERKTKIKLWVSRRLKGEKKQPVSKSAISVDPISKPIDSPESEPESKPEAPPVTLNRSKLTRRAVTKSAGQIDYASKMSDFIGCLKVAKVRRTKVRVPSDEYFDKIVGRLEEKLVEFKLDAQVINIIKGPVVDTFELELGAGIKVSRVSSITEDLSLALLGVPIRMVYPMKGKTTVGVEIPRSPREIIFLDEVLESDHYRQTEHKLPIVMGKDAYGEVAIADLASMPHMLVAGVTGSGKSVFINALIVSLLIKLSPEKLKLILIDPKQLELALYARVPHLLLPVVTDSKEASLALLWASQEMERRYSILRELGVRNIEGYNAKLKTASDDELAGLKQFFPEGGQDYSLPLLVIIIDEFADLILTKSGKEIENNVCRLAAKARAAGIHLVVATQRPSVDVITGLIKSNFPTRISFRVTSNVDSRTILNTIGSEKLLGKGDMLFKHGIEMSRLHSAFVDEAEIENLMDSLCTETPEFDSEALAFMENEASSASGPNGAGPGASGSGKDELYDEAVKVIVEYGMASASMLQRRLKIGYNRAANLIDQLEEGGVIGPQEGPRPRKVLISGS